MDIGIYIENCKDIKLTGNRFHNIDRPVVAKNTKGLMARGNVATYDENQFRLKPVVIAVKRTIYG